MNSAPITLVLASLLLSSPALTCEKKKEAPGTANAAITPAAAVPEAAKPTPAAPRMVVAIDPATGELRAPTQEELRALTSRSQRGPLWEGAPTTVETLPDGRKRARLGPEYFRWSVVRVNADGSLTFDCIPTKGISNAPAAPAAPER